MIQHKPISRKYLFIVNPNSGKRKHKDWEALISKVLAPEDYEILYTRFAGHSKSILADIDHHSAYCVVAVGGDGTINELLPAILHSGASLGIVPRGSGNGLARHLEIPMDPLPALKRLASGKSMEMDILVVNGQLCCNTSGLGFSSTVARNFGADGKRGFWSYFKLALKLYKSSPLFEVEINGKPYHNIWSIEIANSSQMGNNAIVSPFASVSDGIFDILLMTKPSIWEIPGLMYMVFTRNILKSKLSKFFTATSANIRLPILIDHHIDGEYIGMVDQLDVKILPSAVKIIN